MRLFGLVDGAIDGYDRPMFFIEPFTIETSTTPDTGAVYRSVALGMTNAASIGLGMTNTASIIINPTTRPSIEVRL